MSRRLHRLVALAAALALALVLAPAGLHAQSRLSLEAHVAPVVPLGRMVDTLAVRSEQIEGRGVPGLSSLVDRRGSVGFRAGLRVVSGVLEAGYSMTFVPLEGAREVCRGSEPVATLPDGTIEDAAVRYECVPRSNAPRVTLLDDRTGIMIHALDGGLRLVASGERTRRGRLERALSDRGATVDRLRVYGVVGGGPRLATASEIAPARAVRFGFGLTVGGGLDARVAPRIAVFAEVRYGFDLVSTSGSTSRNADRAVASGRGVLGALTDTFHTAHSSLGVRVDLR